MLLDQGMHGLPDPPPVITATMPLTLKSVVAERFVVILGYLKVEGLEVVHLPWPPFDICTVTAPPSELDHSCTMSMPAMLG
jgi:hypothetical protein